MTPGYLAAALQSSFGETAPACQFCEDTRQVRMVAVNGQPPVDVDGQPMDVEIPCPLCWLVSVPFPWFRDIRIDGAA